MQRINTAGAITGITNIPTGAKGYSDGTPSVTAPTGLDAAPLNALQEELAQFIEAQGLAVLTSGTDTFTQLQAAIAKYTKQQLSKTCVASLSENATAPANTEIYSVTYGATATGNHPIWVAVGVSDGVHPGIMTSYDGVHWTQNTSVSKNLSLSSVAYHSGVWVAVGAYDSTHPFILTATNPQATWTENTAGVPAKTLNLNSVAYGNGVWVAVGTNDSNKSFILTASDPTSTWTQNAGAPTLGTGINLLSVAYGNGHWVATGNYTGATTILILTASDPTSTWTQNATTPAHASGLLMRSVAYANSMWVAVGPYDGTRLFLMTASDPTSTWTQNTNIPTGSYSLSVAIFVTYFSGLCVIGCGDDQPAFNLLVSTSDNPTGAFSFYPIACGSGGGSTDYTIYALAVGTNILVGAMGQSGSYVMTNSLVVP